MQPRNRSPFTRRRLLASFAGLFPARRLRGQQPSFSADVSVVNVLATVRDKQGRIVQDLTKDDFVLEDEGRPQTIRYFSRQTDLPLTLGLLVDTSLSQREVLGEERRASYRFFERVLREDRDLAFLIHFDSEVELLQDLTSSRKALEAALAQLDTPQPAQLNRRSGPTAPRGRRGGGTTLYDSVLLASDELMKKQAGRKALVLLSDGVDTGSRTRIEEAIEAAQRTETLAYAVRFYDPRFASGMARPMGGPGRGGRGGRGGRMPFPDYPDGKKTLERVAKETGGGFFDVTKKMPLDAIYDRIQEELRNQYNLGFTPDQPDSAGRYHKLRVSTRRKGLTVQTRQGYWPQPQRS